MKVWFSPAELVDLALPGLPQTKRGINIHAETQGWKLATSEAGVALARRRVGPGGGLEYHFSLLPERAQVAIAAAALKVQERPAEPVTFEPAPDDLRDADIVRRDARIAVIAAADAHAKKARLARYASDPLFAKLYNGGRADVEPWIVASVKSVSPRNLKRWRSALKKEGPQALAGKFRQRSTSVLERAEGGRVKTYIAALLTKNTYLTADHVRDLVADEFKDAITTAGTFRLPSLRTFERFIAGWQAENEQLFMFMTDPDRWKSTVRHCGSNMYAHIGRLNQLWEIDASPADVLCTDGRRNLYVVIDIWSRRMFGLITKTPCTDASLSLVRRAIIEWGVPEVLRTDNGSDFTSHQFKRAVASLGIEQDLCPPHSPERKASVERNIGTIQRGCMRLLPGFIGHDVKDRKQIEARKTFAARLGESDKDAFCVELSAQELQDRLDRWLATKYAHRAHSGLGGVSPFERAGSWAQPLRAIDNLRALDLLLAPAAGADGMRTATKRGIKFDNTRFIAPEILAGQSVFVRCDPEDMGRIFCFESEVGRFICEGIAPERLGIDPAAAHAEARHRQRKFVKEQTAEIRREARRIKPHDMIDGVLRTAAARSEGVIAFPQRSQPHSTPSLEEAAAARAEAQHPEFTDEDREAHERRVAEIEASADAANVVQLEETPRQRFARAKQLEVALGEGDDVDPQEVLWLGGYQQTPEYRAQSTMLEDFGPDWLKVPK